MRCGDGHSTSPSKLAGRCQILLSSGQKLDTLYQNCEARSAERVYRTTCMTQVIFQRHVLPDAVFLDGRGDAQYIYGGR